jgi:hypothetical protein
MSRCFPAPLDAFTSRREVTSVRLGTYLRSPGPWGGIMVHGPVSLRCACRHQGAGKLLGRPSGRPRSGSDSRSGSPPTRSFARPLCAATRATFACISPRASDTSHWKGSGSPMSCPSSTTSTTATTPSPQPAPAVTLCPGRVHPALQRPPAALGPTAGTTALRARQGRRYHRPDRAQADPRRLNE